MIGDVQAGYDRVADEYAAQFRDELDGKPFDRTMLDWLIEKVEGLGPICDLGVWTGTGCAIPARPWSANLRDRSVRRDGERAQALNPGIPFEQGNMGGGGAPRVEACLTSRGSAVAGFPYIGKETVHKDEWWGKPVSVDVPFYETDEMGANVRAAALQLEDVIERGPYPEIEFQSRRAHIFARNPTLLAG